MVCCSKTTTEIDWHQSRTLHTNAPLLSYPEPSVRVSELRQERKKHAHHDEGDVGLCEPVGRGVVVYVAIYKGLFGRVRCRFCHGVHRHVSGAISTCVLVNAGLTYKNVPPEKSNIHPVVHASPSSPPRRPRPSKCTMAQVKTAPAGA
jgi:hypothetical protein